MADETITPALTPEEWETPATFVRDGILLSQVQGDVFIASERTRTGCGLFDGALPAVIALANAALPAGDQRKITRDDVSHVRAAAEVLAADTQEAGMSAEERAEHARCVESLNALAAKLLALLPPE